MTPQLQQAIKLLQLSTLDLQQEIQEALDSNPLLEVEEGSDEPQVEKNNVDSDDSAAEATASASSDTLEAGDALEKNDLPDELPIDSTWDEYYSASSAPAPGPSNDDEQIFQGETTEDIQENLLWNVCEKGIIDDHWPTLPEMKQRLQTRQPCWSIQMSSGATLSSIRQGNTDMLTGTVGL